MKRFNSNVDQSNLILNYTIQRGLKFLMVEAIQILISLVHRHVHCLCTGTDHSNTKPSKIQILKCSDFELHLDSSVGI